MSENDSDSGHFGAAYSLETGDQTRAHYRSWAKTYDAEVGEQNGYAQPARVAAALASRLADRDEAILDAGCGSGLSGLALARSGYTTIDGCDFSPEMLREAQTKNCYRNLFEADLNAGLPSVETGTYAALTCVGVFSFGHVLPEACDELLRVVEPSGWLIIALNEPFWDRGDLKAKLNSLEEAGQIEIDAVEYGDHLPGHDVMGYVIAARKI